MNRISDFKPLALVELPDIGPIPGLGLTLIVGPNSAGKTRLLSDLNLRLCGDPQRSVVATRIDLKQSDFDALLKCLEEEGYIRISTDQNGRRQLTATTPYLGTAEVQQTVPIDQVRGWYDAYPAWTGAESDRSNEFLLRVGRLLVTNLSLGR